MSAGLERRARKEAAVLAAVSAALVGVFFVFQHPLFLAIAAHGFAAMAGTMLAIYDMKPDEDYQAKRCREKLFDTARKTTSASSPIVYDPSSWTGRR